MDREHVDDVRAYMSEMMGTFVLVFLSAGAVCAAQLYPGTGSFTSVLGIALAAGLSLAVGLAMTNTPPRGYLNPAVTMLLWGMGKLDGGRAMALMGVQFLGAAVAGGMLRFVLGNNQLVMDFAHLGTPHINYEAFGGAGLTAGVVFKGVMFELIFTFLLLLVVFVVSVRVPKTTGQVSGWLAPLYIGMTLTVITLAGFHLTGAAANPARWFGTVIWESTVSPLRMQRPYADWLAFVLGPFAASFAAQYVIGWLIREKEHEHAHDTEKSAVAAGSSH
ncbi:MAG: aquaporin [Gemmataceae bacterium]